LANPQKENGHVDIANDIAEALARIRLPGQCVQVLWVILRKTYGWQKKNDWISLSQFSQMTGMKKPHVIRALRKLIEMRIVIKKGNGATVSYGVQKDYHRWKALPKKITLPKKVISITQKDNLALPKKVPTINTITNNTYTNKRACEDFEKFWQAYPRKIGKAYAKKCWLKLVKTESITIDVVDKITATLEQQIKYWKRKQRDMEKIPHPSTWLNQQRWEDEIHEELPSEQNRQPAPQYRTVSGEQRKKNAVLAKEASKLVQGLTSDMSMGNKK
jgi:phage replication O-like protein O